MLLPGRNRSMCLRKFNAEDKANSKRVTAALKAKKPIDKSMLKALRVDVDKPRPAPKPAVVEPAPSLSKRKRKKSKATNDEPDAPESEAVMPEEELTQATPVQPTAVAVNDSDDDDEFEEVIGQVPTIS